MKRDENFADEIIDLHKVLHGTADGEWKWINEHKRQDYIRALDKGDRSALSKILSNFFRESASYGIHSLYRNMQDALQKDFSTWKEFTEQTDHRPLSMPNIGNPVGMKVRGVFMAPDQPRHDYFALKIRALKPNTVLEIGGGYGGLALQLSRRMRVKYIDIDLPETLYLAYYFLSKAGINVKWALKNRPDADVVLVPADRKHLVQSKVDVVFNANSLSEMGKTTVNEYFQSVNTVWKPEHVLHQNSNVLLFPHSGRHIEVLARDFPLDKKKYVEVYRAMAPWQGAGGRYREFVQKVPSLTDILRTN
jgi:hypothetical protein